ncbi:MAG: hypothetical protein KGY55_04705 [Candidatus Thermoplasmatota archaeon]|nr:hypothetical protein [Candidatus Thermoplasmatota archaeon]
MSRSGTTGDIGVDRTLFLVLLVAAVALLVMGLIVTFVVWPVRKDGPGMLVFSGILFVFLIWTVLKKR